MGLQLVALLLVTHTRMHACVCTCICVCVRENFSDNSYGLSDKLFLLRDIFIPSFGIKNSKQLIQGVVLHARSGEGRNYCLTERLLGMNIGRCFKIFCIS